MKRIIALVISCIMMICCLPLSQLMARAEDEIDYEKCYAKFIVGGREEIVSVAIRDESLLVPIEWISEALKLEIEESAVTVALNHDTDNYYARQLKNNYKDAPVSSSYTIHKPGVELSFCFNTDSSVAKAVSPYLGVLAVDLGTEVTIAGDSTEPYVPVNMFCNIFNASLEIIDGCINVVPCRKTAVDILHSDFDYSYDVLSDSGFSKEDYAHVAVYSRISNLFKGVIGLDPVKFINAYTDFDEKTIERFCNQMCLNDEKELEKLNEAECLAVELLVPGAVSAAFDIPLNELAQKAQSADLELSATEKLYGAGITTVKNLKSARKAATEARAKYFKFLDNRNALTNIGEAGKNAIPVFLEYLNSVYEIENTQAEYAAAAKVLSESLDACNSRILDDNSVKEFKAQINSYSSKSKNPFENEELMADMLNEFWPSLVEQSAKTSAKGLGDYLKLLKTSSVLKNGISTLTKYAVIWDVSEVLTNWSTGGSFDMHSAMMDSLLASMMLCDSTMVLNRYKMDVKSFSLNEYKQLEWARLQSAYIVRQDIINIFSTIVDMKEADVEYYKREIEKEKYSDLNLVDTTSALERDLKDAESALESAEKALNKVKSKEGVECDEIAELMAILLTDSNYSTTQEYLDKSEKNSIEERANLLNNTEFLQRVNLTVLGNDAENNEKKPIENAIALFTDNDGKEYEFSTDKQGIIKPEIINYLYAYLPLGTYTLNVNAGGYEDYEHDEEVEVTRKEKCDLGDILLEKVEIPIPVVTKTEAYKSDGKKHLKIDWEDVTIADGYEIEYDLSSGEEVERKETETEDSLWKRGDTKTFNIEKFRIRAYIEVDEKRLYSKWSEEISASNKLREADPDKIYVGEETKGGVTISYEFTISTDGSRFSGTAEASDGISDEYELPVDSLINSIYSYSDGSCFYRNAVSGGRVVVADDMSGTIEVNEDGTLTWKKDGSVIMLYPEEKEKIKENTTYFGGWDLGSGFYASRYTKEFRLTGGRIEIEESPSMGTPTYLYYDVSEIAGDTYYLTNGLHKWNMGSESVGDGKIIVNDDGSFNIYYSVYGMEYEESFVLG